MVEEEEGCKLAYACLVCDWLCFYVGIPDGIVVSYILAEVNYQFWDLFVVLSSP